MDKMRNIIHKDRRIKFHTLIDKSGLSITEYNKVKSYFEAKYADELMYDKENKEWISLMENEKSGVPE